MNYKIITILFLSFFNLIFFTWLDAQVNFEPVNNSVYQFLERMSIKGVIRLNEEILPFSRKYIAEKIVEIDKVKNKLSAIECDELVFYVREYSSELKRLKFNIKKYEIKNKLLNLGYKGLGFNKFNRFRLINYDEDKFGFYLDPVFRLSYAKNKNGTSTLWSNGLRMYGHIENNIGFELQFYDNHASGYFFNIDRKFSRETGYEFQVGKNAGSDFDRMNANLTYSWNWGSVTIGKDFNYYGSGEDGKIILSNKAPSFPFIKLEANPANWFRFSYIHGSLNSQVIDSNSIRLGFERDHFPKISKYFVAHMFSFTPFSFFNFSLGESVIYSDRFEPIYLVPVAFFRLADHYLTDPDESAGNAQLFASFWLKSYKLKTEFYGSVFVDELSIGNSDNPQAIAYNLGIKTIEPVIPESEFILEYSKILPFVYFHSDKAQTFQNYGYDLGHWIGSNADEMYIAFCKRIVRGFNINAWYSYIRKGSEESFNEKRYQKNQIFLWGKNKNYSEYGIKFEYELLNNVYTIINYSKIQYSIENNEENNSMLIFTIGYGIQ